MPQHDTEDGQGGRDWWRAAYWGFAAVVVSTAFLGTRLTEAVRWTAFDFLFAIGIFGITGLALEIAFRTIDRRLPRALVAGGILCALALVWGYLATQD